MTPEPSLHVDAELASILAEVRLIEAQMQWLVDDAFAGGFRSTRRGSGIEFDEVREYIPGDDPRAIDWNVTARVGRPFVKKFVEERELTMILAVDSSASMDAGSGAWSYRQVAARVAATFALTACRTDDNIGLVTFDRDVLGFVAPDRGRAHASRIVRDCLATRGVADRSGFGAALRWIARVQRRRCVVILVSDFYADLDTDALEECGSDHDLVAVHLQSADERAPRIGVARVADPESGRHAIVDWSDARVREAYERSIVDERERVAQALRSAGARSVTIRTPAQPDPHAVATPLRQWFGAGRG